MNKNEVTPVQIAIRIVIIIVVIVILLLVSFALVRFVPKVLGSLSNFRNIFGAKERLAISLDNPSIAHNEKSVLTVTQTRGVSEGKYELSFSCAKIDSDTYLKIVKDGQRDVISCEDSFLLPISPSSASAQQVTIEHVGDIVSYDQPISITVKHISASSTLSSDMEVLTVRGKKNNIADKPVSTSTPSTIDTTQRPVPTAPSTYHPSPALLTATLGSVTVDQNGRANVTFYVTNNGEQNSGSWAFSAYLPRLGQTAYQSPYQPSIPPGGTSTMYLAFDDAQAGTIVLHVQNSQISATLR